MFAQLSVYNPKRLGIRGLGDAASDALAQYEATGNAAALNQYYALKYPTTTISTTTNTTNSAAQQTGRPTPYQSFSTPSTDPAVYMGTGRGVGSYIYNQNLQESEMDANQFNSEPQGLNPFGNYVTVDPIMYAQWWNNFSDGPGTGTAPPQNFWVVNGKQAVLTPADANRGTGTSITVGGAASTNIMQAATQTVQGSVSNPSASSTHSVNTGTSTNVGVGNNPNTIANTNIGSQVASNVVSNSNTVNSISDLFNGIPSWMLAVGALGLVFVFAKH